MKNIIGGAVLLGLCFISFLGIKEIYTIAEYVECSTIAFYNNAEIDYANVKYNEKQKNEAKNAAKSILDSGINLRVSDVSSDGETMVCYSRNIYMELDRLTLCPVFIFYECPAGEKKYTDDELCREAVTFVLRNIPRSVKGHKLSIEKISEEDGIVNYRSIFGDRSSFVSLRADTGSVVFYDGYGLFQG